MLYFCMKQLEKPADLKPSMLVYINHLAVQTGENQHILGSPQMKMGGLGIIA